MRPVRSARRAKSMRTEDQRSEKEGEGRELGAED